MKPERLFIALILLVMAAQARAGSLDSSVIGMFPKDVGELGYADLSGLRGMPWYAQLQAQMVPVSLYGFEKLLEKAEMRETSPFQEVAWARVSARVADGSGEADVGAGPARNTALVAVAIADFDEDALQLALKSLQIPSVQFENYTLYDARTGSGSSDTFFTLVDWQTIAFGPLAQLKRILAVRAGDEENLLENKSMMTLIDQANGQGVFWGVLDSARAASLVAQLLPGAGGFSQSTGVIGGIKRLLIRVDAPSDVEVNLEAAVATGQDALVFSQLLQAELLVRRVQTDVQNNPELAELLGTISVGAHGSLVDIGIDLTNAELVNLIEHNTFVM